MVILCRFRMYGRWIPSHSAIPLEDPFSHDFLKNRVCCCSTKLNAHGPFQPSSDYNLLVADTNHNFNLIKETGRKTYRKGKLPLYSEPLTGVLSTQHWSCNNTILVPCFRYSVVKYDWKQARRKRFVWKQKKPV